MLNLLSVSVSADGPDLKFDEKVVRHVDGLVKAMHYKFSKAIDQEYENNQSSDDEVDTKALGNSKQFMPDGDPYYGCDDMYPYYGYGGMYPYYGYGGYYGGMDGNPWTIWKRSTESNDFKQEIKAEFNDQVLKPFRIGALKIVQDEVDSYNARYSLKKRSNGDATGATEAAVSGSRFERVKGVFSGITRQLQGLFQSLNTLWSSKNAGYVAGAVISVAAIVFFFRYLFTRNREEIDE